MRNSNLPSLIELQIKDVKILTLDTEAHNHGEDPRSLGIMISSMEYVRNGEVGFIRLDYCYRDFLKEHCLPEYVDDLILIAKRRNEKIDLLFQRTRGPSCSKLERWLDQCMNRYDLVLGHSTPFQTVVLAQRFARKYSKPVAILPHFHFDDIFYHWRSYYTAMQEADLRIFLSKERHFLVF